MTQKWNLQDIRPAEPRKKRPIRHPSDKPPTRPQQIQKQDIPEIIIADGTKNHSRRLIISIVLFVAIIGTAIGLSAAMGKTEITIYPEHRQPNISAEFTAYPDKREGALSYTIMTLESTSEKQVKATGQVQVDELSTGTIEIIKTTPGAERLIKNTRFRTPDGLVFRIQESVVVPGSIDGVPGTIQAKVFADETGEEYNLTAGKTFDIPGFQENGFTELYESISARNKETFTGGFSGPQFQIEEAELQTARQSLQVDLRNTLLAQIQDRKAAGTIAFPNAVAITYNQLPAVEYDQQLVTIREQAVLQIPLFKEDEFAAFLAEEAVATYEGGPVRIDNSSELAFNYISPTTSESVIANEPSLTFKLSGKPLLIWEYDAEALAKNLATLPKTAINNAVPAYPGIKGAKVHITPFWQRTFPDDPTEIQITEELKDLGAIGE